MLNYYTKTVKETLHELDTREQGLSSIEVKERLNQYGPNLIKVKGTPLWRTIIEPFANVFMAVLFVAIAISIIQNEMLDAIIIGAIMMITAIIYYVQTFSTEKILRSLQRHDPEKIEVLRDDKIKSIDVSGLVPGDIIILKEGEKIPADARLMTVNSLRVDESQLTGESMPIGKQVEKLNNDLEVYEQTNMIFKGSFVVGGEATAIIIATGNNTGFGKLAALSSEVQEQSPVQKKIDKLVTQIIFAIIIVAIITFVLALYRGMSVGDSLRFIIALSVSAVPEGLSASISVVLVLGMRRMAKKKALVKSMRAIETIGTLTTIATDKTGTLTKNLLTVQTIWKSNKHDNKFFDHIIKSVNYIKGKTHDPLDIALMTYAEQNKSLLKKYKDPLVVYPFDNATAMSGNLREYKDEFFINVKGSPESILACSNISKKDRKEIDEQLHSMASRGYRVIAIAHYESKVIISDLDYFKDHKRLVFDGFVGIADVIRPESKASIARTVSAGVTVRMITGDHFETAYQIGQEIGLVTSRDQVFDSRRMNKMTDEELEDSIENIRVFSRVIPEHKHRLLAILKKKNITAMTGDGVNDVPALTNAHVGIAMGSGASIAKDASDIILIDDNFRSIVNAIHEGRTVYANIKRMVVYLVSTNIGEVLVALGSLIMGVPLPISPIQILWVNLVTDTSMVIPLGLEPGEKRNMNKGPQKPNAPLLSRFMRSRIILVALVMMMVTLGIYIYYSNLYGFDYGRTIAFSVLVVMQWASAFNSRSDYESVFIRIKRFNLSFYIGLLLAVVLQTLALFGPLADILHTKPVSIFDLIVSGTFAFIVTIFAVEIHKYIGRRYFNKGSRLKPIKLTK